MVSARYLIGATLAIASVSAVVVPESEDFLEQASRLLKRQEPGTPAYNCHNTCGQALRQGRFSGDARCSNDIFLTNYKNCLQCSGPDNHGIWSFYGNSVGSFGRACGLSTTPLSGKQPDVPEAIPAVEPGAATTSAGAAASSAAPSSASGSSSAAATSPVSAPSSASTSAGSGSATRTTSSASGAASASGGALVGGGGSSTSHPNVPTSAPVPAGAAAVAKNMMGMAVAVVAVGAQLW
ncbi:hypothetical protein PspLS_01103 [Pyricularia sp. CBS 133598]|nr:hypothetical protein PspLS_01103 [Pyricularia sp. CBS 133598]